MQKEEESWRTMDGRTRVVGLTWAVMALVPALFVSALPVRTRAVSYEGGRFGLAMGALIAGGSLTVVTCDEAGQHSQELSYYESDWDTYWQDIAHHLLRGGPVPVLSVTSEPAGAAVFVDGSPVFETLEGFKGLVLAKYADAGSPLLSGYLIGEKYLQGQAAALDVEFDKGHIVLLGFCPQWRAQSFGTFRVVFNATLYGRPPSGRR
jgi:hypothetical protein